MDRQFPPDHFITGMVIAALSITLCYIVLVQFAVWWEQALGNKPILADPAPQLIILVTHMIVFRQLVLSANRMATGTGFFVVLFAIAVYYIATHTKELFHG